eukprot:GAHX01000058.1.p1 GENE.GAHX01000058.1~~GAHX01000058.1.p1  ORF type:complete len:398 (+),score=73.80 GAHX01000058.1:62-1195(+)
MKSGLQKVKEHTKNLVDKSKRLITSQINSNLEEAVSKVTWNDNHLPKVKWKSLLFGILSPSNIHQGVSANHYIDREVFLSAFETRLTHYKWKVVIKTLLLIQEFSTTQFCGDYIIYVISNRPNIFNFSFVPQTSSYGNQSRAQCINFLLAYNKIRLANLIKHGRLITGFNNKELLDQYVEKRFGDVTVFGLIEDTVSQLSALSQITFPNMDLANSCTIFLSELIRNEALVLVEGIKYVILLKLSTETPKESIEAYKKVVNKLEKTVSKVKIWINNLSMENTGDINVRYENNSMNTSVEDFKQIRDILERISAGDNTTKKEDVVEKKENGDSGNNGNNISGENDIKGEMDMLFGGDVAENNTTQDKNEEMMNDLFGNL